MATLVQSYEQQYSVLTADITAKIGRLKSGHEENRDQLSREIQANFEEANDLLEQLELESRGAGAVSRLAAYRAELQRVREEYRSVLNSSATYNIDNDEAFDDWGSSDQRTKLLDNTERLERTGKNLTEGYRVILETEQIGAAVLQDLNAQRETIQRSRGRLRETDEQLNRSSRLMSSMIARSLQDRLILVLVLFFLGVLLCVGLYFYVT
ncbi:vesicle transport through interaction with t-SNAREs homolog 1A [Plodia interpunctella]|uniref:vesicle transport through interaction with t-SNAREs homolog 1A n=1 Tax=Plodia interpunctella TaxID=58824 RepID=UPI00236830C6|nr:vesicle transport through interaction with t-SNAREs homolog 1A [Plodia interpunctella]XP_053610549.1 vesicle transport through interaction with t-SNAREs homolog 1A [Plodia interpunctella]